MAKTTDLIGYEGLAEMMGITIGSARAYRTRAIAHRKKAEETGDKSFIRPGDLPEPDEHFGQSPAWKRSTIEKWMEQRPGQGNPHGRPGPRKRA